jgi:type II secretory pathway predicted ATPase ExeA
MVEAFFGFERRPFSVSPCLDSYVPIAGSELAVEHSVRCVVRGEGPSLIIAGSGLGKTMCAMKIAQVLGDRMQVVFLASSPLCTRRALLQSILYHLGLPHREMSEGDLRIELQEHLRGTGGAGGGLLLLVDEAQTLSMKLLDELRILTNTLCDGMPCVHLILAGTLKLEDTLAHPHMESLHQRIVARHYLAPLNHSETLGYVQRKIELAGGNVASVFQPDALEAIYRASDGIPRLIDQLADQAILQSGVEAQRPIPASRIGAVWTQLHQLPSPWSTPHEEFQAESQEGFAAQAVTQGSSEDEPSVEFGALEEEPLETDAVSLFQSFLEDSVEQGRGVRSIAGSVAGNVAGNVTGNVAGRAVVSPVPTGGLDESFQQWINELKLSAVHLDPSHHAFVRAESTAKQLPKPVASGPSHPRTGPGQLVGESVDGDDRDMIVMVEEHGWINPFAIR